MRRDPLPIPPDSAGAPIDRPAAGAFAPAVILTGKAGSGIVSQTAVAANPHDSTTHRHAGDRFSIALLRFGTPRAPYNPHSRTGKL